MAGPETPFVLTYPCFVLMAKPTAPFLMWAGKEKCITLFTDGDLLTRFREGLLKESGNENKYAQSGALQFSDRAVMIDTLKQMKPALQAHGTTRIALDPTIGGTVRSVPLGEFIAAFERL